MNRIKIVLKAQGRSQEWFSEKLGVSTASLSLYANNHLSPKLDTLAAIAKSGSILSNRPPKDKVTYKRRKVLRKL